MHTAIKFIAAPQSVSPVQKPFPKYADMITYHSDNLYQYIIDNFNVSSSSMYQLKQGVCLRYFSSNVETNEKLFDLWREHFIAINDLADKNILLYIGHLNIASDLESVFNIINIAILNGLKDLRLIVIGGGNKLKYFENLAYKMNLQEYVVFTGYVDYRDIARYSSISDKAIVYYSDIKENYVRQSMKIRELLAMQKYVLCNNVGDLAEFEDYTYQVHGFSYDDMALVLCSMFGAAVEIAEEYDGVDIADNENDSNIKIESEVENINIVEYCETENTLDDRNIRGYEYIKNNYDWDIIGKKFLQEIEKMTNK